MIILDEQLMGRNLEVEIAKWYRSTVHFIGALPPDTVIKDDLFLSYCGRRTSLYL